MNLGQSGAPLCPRRSGSCDDLRFALPPGYLRRVAAPDDEVDETKRNLLKLAAIAGVLGIGAGGAISEALRYVPPGPAGLSSYPRTQLFDVDASPLTLAKAGGTTPSYVGEYSVESSADLLFDYPLTNEPNFLLNLYPANGQPPSGTNPGAANVPGGIGDNGSIVAFSAICQHLSCGAPSLSYYPPSTCPQTFHGVPFYLHCSCHGSTYDVTNGAANLTGPAVLPLPQITLESDVDGNIYAVGANGPPVFGHRSTLQGGSGVGASSTLFPETPVYLCSFPT